MTPIPLHDIDTSARAHAADELRAASMRVATAIDHLTVDGAGMEGQCALMRPLFDIGTALAVKAQVIDPAGEEAAQVVDAVEGRR